MKQQRYSLFRMTASVIFAMAAMVAVNLAHAGAGWGVSTDATGAPIKVPTYHANSPSGLREDLSPTAAPGAMINSGTALRKFVDTLPGLNAAGANNLGQYIPVAVADTVTYPGSDYYEIGVVEYTERMHSDLPKATTLRGYVQLETASNAAFSKHIALSYPNGAPILDANGNQMFAVDNPHYMGPLINATRGVPVRFKFSNLMPTGHYDPITNSRGGDLFLPVDETLMGAGLGPDGINKYTQNRTNIHLHGTDAPWISDGTPHQWITPAGENTPFKKGASFQNVPDMPDPGPGSGTLYYPNNLSARMMFFHDHTAGITRLNVYAGMAGGYLISDPVEQGLVTSGAIPATQIPLIIQDKTFVPADIVAQDAKWDEQHWGQPGDLWFTHVYETNQDPNSFDGTNPVGRWDYGPWFWPVFPAPLPLPTGEYGNASIVPEAFMDTAVVNGTAYPTFTVQPQAYRFRILNAANDRSINVGLYEAEPLSVVVMNGGAGYSATPVVSISPAPGDLTGNGATATATVTAGVITDITVTNPGSGYTAPPVVTIRDTTGTGAVALAAAGTEVKMVPAAPGNATWPATWPTDGRAGGVPDPATAGPDIVQIGSEGGFLPAPAVIPSTPIGYEYNRRSATVLGIMTHGLYLAPAERADAVIDFSGYCPGTKLILFNDAPAPVPGFDPRVDYYTGDPDQTAVGGAPSTKPGYGPNTRTIMQFVVAGTPVPGCVRAAFTRDPNPNVKNPKLAALQAALPGAYAASQPKPVVGQAAYSGLWGTTFTNSYASIHTGTLRQPNFTFTNGDGVPQTMSVQNKAIQELFDPNYGRMNATLGVELPFTSAFNQTTIPLGFVDPATETIADGETQIWKITHNGVDTHPVHFHLVNVQLINRVGWDGTVKPPSENELGWKETVRMNPLEDVIVAVRAKAPVVPFGQPDSVRAMDPTQPVGVTTGFSQIDPTTGFPATITNAVANFGWEYVWHCHILGHEENDFMRPIVFKYTAIAPAAPINASLNAGVLSWQDPTPSSLAATFGDQQNEIGFRIERSANYGAFSAIGTVPANSTTFTDAGVLDPNTDYSYRVVAYNTGGNSLPSNVVTLVQKAGGMTPSSLTFAAQAIGTTSLTQRLTLTNAAPNPMSISGVSLGGQNNTDFIQTNNCVGNTLTTGASCTIDVAYSPTAGGASTAMLTAATSLGSKTAGLTGGSLALSAALTPSSQVTFASQQVGTSSATQVVTLTNTGGDVLSVSGISLNGGNAADFTQTNNCGTSLAVNTSCAINVTFSPSLVSNESTTLTIGTSAGTKTLTISGLGVAPSASTIPTAPLALAFAAQQVGTTSAPGVATLNNTGIGPLLITNISITGLNPTDFAQTNNCPLSSTGASLPVGRSCTVNVTFRPGATTPRSAMLNFATTAGLKTIALSGGGQGPAATLTPSTPLAFGIQEVTTVSAVQAATLTNTGVGPLTYSSVTISGANAGDFSQTNNCAPTMAAGANCAINVAFKPGTVGVKTATLSVVDSAGTQAILLNGTSRPAYATNLSSTALTYAAQQTATASATQTVALTNTGARALPITGIAIAGPDAGDFTHTSNCGASLAVDATCSIVVTFAPTVAGTKSATLSVTDAAGTPAIALSGSSQVPSSSMVPNAPLTFQAQQVGTAAATAQKVTLSNTGVGPLSVASIAITGVDAADFAQTNNCGASLLAGATGTCTIDVTFVPATVGPKSATLTVVDGAGTYALALTGTSAAQANNLTPATPMAFAAQQTGTTSAAQVVTLTNTGIIPLAVSSVAITGADAAEFTQTNNCGTSLPVGANGVCSINVTFNPATAGAKTASLTVVGGSGTQTIAMSGTAQVASVSLTPATSLAFAAQQVGTASAAQPVVLTNTGVGPLSISGFTISGTNYLNFTQTNNCGASLAPGANCTVNVSFAPTASGTATATLNIADGAGGHTLALSGTADVQSATLTPGTPIAFAAQQTGTASTPQVATLTNNSVLPLSVSSIAITGVDAADFVQANNCGASVAAGTAGTCTIDVSFKPATAGAKSATLSVVDGAGTHTVALGGTAQAPGSSLAPATQLAFAAQQTATTSATQQVTLSNTGIGPLSIGSIAIGGTNPLNFAQSNNCSASLAAGASCTIDVSFSPDSAGPKAATLNVVDAAGTHTLALNGAGDVQQANLTPATPLAFGLQQTGATSAAQAATLTNPGVLPLSISSIAISGPDAADFAQTNNCGPSLAAGTTGTCTINVTFHPAAIGAKSAILTVVDGAGTHSINLNGTGAMQSSNLSPATPMAFGAQQAGSASAAMVATLTNTGSLPLPVGSITLTGANAADFVQTNDCGTSVAPGAAGSCSISITFNPAAAGVKTAALTVVDGAGTHTVALDGTGAVQSTTLTPTSPMAFGLQQSGTTSAVQVATLNNSGIIPLSVGSIAISGADAADFVQTNNCGTSLAAGTAGTCNINVAFAPAGVGPKSASLTVVDGSGTHVVALSGTAAVQSASLTPAAPLVFAAQKIGTSSAPQASTLTNNSALRLPISSIAVTGANASDFVQTNNCGTSLAGSTSCSINVTLAPGTVGTKIASLTVVDATGTRTVALRGTGAINSSSLTPTGALAFGVQKIGTASVAKSVMLKNTGGLPLPISNIKIGGAGMSQFAQTNNCGTSLAVGASCTVNVVFKPTSTGALGATLAVVDAAGTKMVALNGSGAVFASSLTPIGPLAFAPQGTGTASVAKPVVLKNTGGLPLAISSINLGGTGMSQFVQTNNCGTTLAVGASCTINVAFKPTSIGAKSATLTVVDAAGTRTVSLSGTGTGILSSLTPAGPVSFGPQKVITTSVAKSLVLKNTGGQPLPISSIKIGGGIGVQQFVQTNNCGTNLVGGASCTINVAFRPTSVGAKSATLTVVDAAGPKKVVLNGTGQP